MFRRLPTVIILILSLFTLDGFGQGSTPSKPRTAKPSRQLRTTERAKPAPAPAPAPVAAAVAKPAAPPPPPPKTATSRSQRVAVTSTGSLPQRIATSAQPEDAYQRELQSRMVNWHPIEMSFHLLTTASWNSASGRGSAALTDDFGGGLRTTVGPNIDFYFFRDRYAFGTGLWYTIKRMGYTQPPDRLLTPTTPSRTAAFNLQYLQIPITMKLVSNTLFRSGRSFIQYGGTLDFKLAETPIDYQNNYVYQRDGNVAQFTSAGLSLLLAVGYMHRVSRTNDLIMTVQYQRSLTNNAIPENLWAISQHLGFGIGLSF